MWANVWMGAMWHDCPDSDASKQIQAKHFKAAKPRILLACLADFEATESKQFFLVLRAFVGSEKFLKLRLVGSSASTGACVAFWPASQVIAVPPSPG
jgi:hypothetical protein